MKYTLALVACLVCLSAPAFGQELFLLNSNAPHCGQTVATDTQGSLNGQDEVMSFSVGGSAPTTSGGRPTFSDLVIQKGVDTCSVSYLTEFFQGGVIPTLTLTEVKLNPLGGVMGVVLTVTLINASIDSYNLSQDASQRSVEQISFKYEKLGVTTYKVDSNGNPTATPVPATVLWYDPTANMVGSTPKI